MSSPQSHPPQVSHSLRQSNVRLPPISTQLSDVHRITYHRSGRSTPPSDSQDSASSLKRRRSAEEISRDEHSRHPAKREMLAYPPAYGLPAQNSISLQRGAGHLGPKEPPVRQHTNPPLDSVNLPGLSAEKIGASLQLPPIREHPPHPPQSTNLKLHGMMNHAIHGSEGAKFSGTASTRSVHEHQEPNKVTLPPISSIDIPVPRYEQPRALPVGQISPTVKREHASSINSNSPDSNRKPASASGWHAAPQTQDLRGQLQAPSYPINSPTSPADSRNHPDHSISAPLENGYNGRNSTMGMINSEPVYHLDQSNRYMWNVPPLMEEQSHRKRRGNLPKESTAILNEWFCKHLENPYPTEEEKQRFQTRTNLSMSQISNWFINARRRRRPKLMRTGENRTDVITSGRMDDDDAG